MKFIPYCTLLLFACCFGKKHTGNEAEELALAGETPAETSKFVSNLLAMVEKIPAFKSMITKTGFSTTDLEVLFGERNLFGQVIFNSFKLCPVCKDIAVTAAKTNVELRILLDIVQGKTPSLLDIFKLATTKPQNMFLAADNAASKNAYAQSILQKMKEPNPDLEEIFGMVTGRNYKSEGVVDNDKYSVSTTTARKNRHLVEIFQFILRNWRDGERMLRTLSNFPINFVKVLHYMIGYDWSPFRFALNIEAPRLNGKKYLVQDNKGKYVLSHPEWNADDDADIVQLLQEVRVKYPAMQRAFAGPDGNNVARKVVIHIIEESIEIFNRLLGDAPLRKTDEKTKPQ